MTKRCRGPESDGTTLSSMEYNTVFVDTSLDTHLAMLLSNSDTVLDFKNKIILGHAQCFPEIGEILIHSLKVERRGRFYHLPDFMLVWSVFHGVEGNWFLSADASCYTNQKSSLDRTNDHCRGLSSNANEIPALKMSMPDGVTEENIVSEMIDGQKFEKSSDKTTLETGFPAKKKQKMRYNEDLGHSPTLENIQLHVAGEDSLRSLLVGCGVNTDGEAPDSMPGYEKARKLTSSEATAEVSGIRYGQSNKEHNYLIGTSVPAPAEKTYFGNGETSANFLGLHNRKEDLMLNDVMPETLMAEKPQNKLGESVPSTNLEGDTCNTSALGKKRNSKRRKNQLPHDQEDNPKPSSTEYGKEGRSFFSNSADFPGNVALSGTSGVLEREQCEPLSVEVKKGAAPSPLKGTGIKEPDIGPLELKVDNINQLSEPKVLGKASSVKNDLSIIDGKNKETDRPDIVEAQRNSSLNHDLVLIQSEKFETRHEARESTRELVQPDDLLGANGEMEHGSRSKRKVKKSGGKIRDKTVGKHPDNVMHLTPIVPVRGLNSLKHHETEKADSILPTAETDLNAGREEDRDLSMNYQSDLNLGEVGVTLNESNLSVGLVDTNCAVEGSKPIGNIGKKKRAQKAVAKIQDMSDVELKTKEGNSIGPCTETNKSEKKDEERELSLNHDLEVIRPYNKTSACPDPLVTLTEVGSTAKLLDSNFLEEPEISHGRRKKKRVRKSADTNLDRSGMERTEQKTDQPDIYEEQREPSLNQDPALRQSENLGSLDWHEVDGNIRESVQPELFSCPKGETEHPIKNKRRAKKSRGKIQNETDGEHSDNGVHLTPSAVPNLDLSVLKDLETKRTEGILPTVETDLAVESKEDRNLLVNHEPDMNQPEEGVTVKEPKLSAGLMDAMVASKDGNLNGNRKKKKKSRKAAGKIQDTSDLELEARKGEGVGPHDEIHKFKKMDGVRGLSPNYDCEVMVPLSSKVSECTDPESKLKEAGSTSKFLDGDMIVEPQSSGGHGGKKRVYNSADTNLYKSDMEHINHGTSGSSVVLHCLPTNHIPEETDKGGSISVHKRKNVRMKNLDDSAANAEEKVTGADGNKSDLVKFTQTMKDVGINEKETKKKSSASDCHKVLPAKEKGNHVENLACNQAQNNSENLNKDKKTKKKAKRQLVASDVQENLPTRDQEASVEVFATQENVSSFLNSELDGRHVDSSQPQNNSENLNKDKKTKKKAKRQLVASDVQENLPTRDQEVSVEVFATQENVSSFLNSELDGRHVDSSQVVSHRVEEKIEEFHETAADTDDLARSFPNKDEGINFKHYFVCGQKQDKTASGDKAKKATKSSEVMNSGIKVKKHGMPSVSTSTELQSPLKSYESKDGKKQSHVRCATDRKDGDLAVNSIWNEAITNSNRKSLEVTGNGVGNSSPSATPGMSTLQKHNETPATSSFVKEKNLSLDKSSLGRSGSFPENRGDKRWQIGLNVSNKTAFKTPQKNSLFMKEGAIFRESSGESSGNDNGTAYSDSSTCSPSGSSSPSGCSEGESDLSQASARNGSNDAKGRSSGGKNISKLDLSASNEMTMDMILRSSKRFKKAKLVASQNELEQTENQALEFVPDSQPNQ